MTRPTVHQLPNGVRLVLERIPRASSVAAGIWLAQGSRHEAPRENGLTHFAEHMLFKGTRDRHWRDLSRTMNLLGGQFNACTSTDWVKVYTHVVEDDLDEAMRLMASMLLESSFPGDEMQREREVILEEIAMYEDQPEDLCYEHFTRALFLPHPVGRPVIGTEELVAGFTRKELAGYWERVLAPSRMLVSLAGRLDIDKAIALTDRLFGGLGNDAPPQDGLADVVPGRARVELDRDLEQINFAFGVVGPARRDPDRFAWIVYDTILGGGMGSRLFDEVREKRGLAYAIGSSVTALDNTGYLMISGSTRPETARLAIEICSEQLADLADNGPSEPELDIARRQLERTHLLALESLGARANVNGERELYGLRHLTAAEVIRRLHGVTVDDVRAVARRVMEAGPPAACLVGPVDKAAGALGALPASA